MPGTQAGSAVQPLSASAAAAPRAGRARLLAIALLIAAWALCYLPRLGATELRSEEGRRLVPAREMLASGEWMLPTLWGQPYLNKPPLFFWCVAGTAQLRGRADELALRLPSALGALAAALLVAAAVGAAGASPAAAAVGGACALFAPFLLEKGVSGEIEALLTALVAAALYAWWRALAGSWGWALAAGLALGAALLAKGPPVLVFFIGGALAHAALERSWAPLRARTSWIALGLGLACFLPWVAAVLARLDSAAVLQRWGGELDRSRGLTLGSWLLESAQNLAGGLLGCAPAALALALALARPTARAALRAPLARFALAALVPGLVMALWPGAQQRYVLPVLPWSCVLAALALAPALAARGEPAARGARAERAPALRLAVAAGALAALAGLLGLAACFAPLDGWRASPWSLPLVALALAAGLAAVLGRRWGPAARLALALAGLVGARALQQTDFAPAHADDKGRRACGAALTRALAPGATLWIELDAQHNTLYYVERRVRARRPESELRAGDGLLVDARDSTALERLPSSAHFLGTFGLSEGIEAGLYELR